jgi:hypothetical protein
MGWDNIGNIRGPAGAGGVANLIYRREVNSLRGPDTEALNAYPTVALAIGTLMLVVIDPDGSGQQEQTYELTAGAASVDDGGHVAPLDYNSTTNNKYWARVGG